VRRRAATLTATVAAAGTLLGGVPAQAAPSDRVVAVVREGRVLTIERRVESISGDYRETATTEQVQVDLAADVLFAFDSADLSPQAAELVAEAARAVADESPATVSVVGHTDSVGDTAYNQTLSQQRAQAVASALQAAAPAQYQVEGRGESEPVADEAGGDAARAQNRRVTITFAVGG
jgi:OOP family OmpA-OmpF porin